MLFARPFFGGGGRYFFKVHYNELGKPDSFVLHSSINPRTAVELLQLHAGTESGSQSAVPSPFVMGEADSCRNQTQSRCWPYSIFTALFIFKVLKRQRADFSPWVLGPALRELHQLALVLAEQSRKAAHCTALPSLLVFLAWGGIQSNSTPI